MQGLCRVPLRVLERAAYKLSRKLSRAGILFLQAFVLACSSHHLARVAVAVEGIPRQDLPVVKNVLGEGLSTSVRPQASDEAKGFIHKQVDLHDKHGGASHWGLVKDMALLLVQDSIDATNHLF